VFGKPKYDNFFGVRVEPTSDFLEVDIGGLVK
jgi:hypothetical protein